MRITPFGVTPKGVGFVYWFVYSIRDITAPKVITSEENYEDETVEIPDASPLEVLRELMAANDLRQKDLAPELGTESIVVGSPKRQA